MKRIAYCIVGIGIAGLIRSPDAYAFSNEVHGGAGDNHVEQSDSAARQAPAAHLTGSAPSQPGGYDFSSSLFNFSMRRADAPRGNADAPPKDAGASSAPKNSKGALGRYWDGLVDWLGL